MNIFPKLRTISISLQIVPKRTCAIFTSNLNFKCLNGVDQQKRKLSYSFNNGTKLLQNETLGSLLNKAADVEGDSVAVISDYQGVSKTYLEFRNEAEKLASGFLACGLQKGDRIGIYSPNCYEWALTKFAAAKAGLILVGINPALQPQELEYALKIVKCKAIVSCDKFKTQDFYEVLNKVLPNLSSCSSDNIQCQSLPDLKTVVMISDEEKNGTIRLKDVISLANKDSDTRLSEIEKIVQFDDPALILYTSGTTGFPKGAVLTHHNISNNAIFGYEYYGFDTKKPVVCCQLPLFHSFGCVQALLGSVIKRGTIIFPSAGFDSTASLKSIERHKCTIILGTPTMYIDIVKTLKNIKTDISSLEVACLGGAPSPDSVLKMLHDEIKIPNVLIGYGLTETSPGLAQMRRGLKYEDVLQQFLEPVSYAELKIVDGNGCVVPKNEMGEICAKGHPIFQGYWDDREKTKEAIDEKGWFHTGDLGIMNEKGWIKIVGRIKDMVIKGGENIYAVEVENFISSHPAVQEAYFLVIPKQDCGGARRENG